MTSQSFPDDQQEANEPPADGIYHAIVRHFRFRPVKHKIEYRVFSLLMDIDQLGEQGRALKWFGRNGLGPLSFGERTHGPGTGEPVGPWVRSQFGAAGLTDLGSIKVLFFPRVFGYAFNPLTVYYGYGGSGQLRGLLYAVRNTFGGRHAYLIPLDATAKANKIDQRANKRFHVSPFVDMPMRYSFIGLPPGDRLALSVNVADIEGPLLNTSLTGTFERLSDKSLRAAFFAYPMMSLKIIGGIHWEAVKLMAKGLRLRKGDPDPDAPVTVIFPDRPLAPLANSALAVD